MNVAPAKDLFFDYYGFPDWSYKLTYPAPTNPALGRRVVSLLQDAGLPAKEASGRGYDHGVFVPLRQMYVAALTSD